MSEPFMTHSKISLGEMIDVARAEANRIEGSQRALVLAALRSAPDAAEMRKRDVLDHIALFLERIEPHLGELRRIVQRQNRSRW